MSESRDHAPSISSALDWSVAPDGWRPLADPAEDGEPVEGLLSDGRVTEAEWWGPVPEELWDAAGDGSGLAWAASFDDRPDSPTLIGWRPYSSAKQEVGANSRDEP